MNEEQSEQKEFILGPVVFGSLYKKWFQKNTGYKVKLSKLAEENPDLKAKIESSIKNTEGLLNKYRQALQNWQDASRDAKERYDKTGGVGGKVKQFFGFEPGKPNDKIFGDYNTDDRKFKEGSKYTIRDILSMDFNIGLTAEEPTTGEALKEEVQQMVAFVEYLKKKKNSGGSSDQEKGEEKLKEKIKDLEYGDSFDFFANLLGLQQPTAEILIKEEEDPFEDDSVYGNYRRISEKKFNDFKEQIPQLNNNKEILAKIKNLVFHNTFFVMFFLEKGDDNDTLEKFYNKCNEYFENNNIGKSISLESIYRILKVSSNKEPDDFKNNNPSKLRDLLRVSGEKDEEEEVPNEDKEKVKEVVDKLQETSPVFNDEGFTKSVYLDKDSPWGKWARRHSELLGFLGTYSNNRSFTKLTPEQQNELPELYDLKIQHVKAQLKAYAKFSKNEKILNTIKKPAGDDTLLKLHKKHYSDIANAAYSKQLNYSEEKEKTEDDTLKEKLKAVIGTKIKEKGEIVFIGEFHKNEEGEYKMGPTAQSISSAGNSYKNLFDILINNKSPQEEKLFLVRYKKEEEEFSPQASDNGQIITEKEFLFLLDSSSGQNTQEQLIKLIKPLIREKLKRKQNGKKNLRN